MTTIDAINDEKIKLAFTMASAWHDGQIRKYTSEPYIGHPVRVALMLIELGFDVDVICSALLHDVIEDCKVGRNEIEAIFGSRIAEIVDECSNKFDRSAARRSARKMAEIERLSKCSDEAKAIKLADAIDNIPSIVDNDQKFAKIYLGEKSMLASKIGGVARNRELEIKLNKIIEDGMERIRMK